MGRKESNQIKSSTPNLNKNSAKKFCDFFVLFCFFVFFYFFFILSKFPNSHSLV